MIDEKFLEELRKSLGYDSETGEFRWKVGRGNQAKVGSLAGNVRSDGRLCIEFKGKIYYAHRLAWLLTHCKWPEGVIDHMDGNPSNNRIDNLRDVSCSINGQNQRKAQSTNNTGYLGVGWHKKAGKFRALIYIGGKNKHIGYFKTPEEAHAAYLTAKRELHEGCTI